MAVNLRGRIALVAGATRGTGRGIALAEGARAGAFLLGYWRALRA